MLFSKYFTDFTPINYSIVENNFESYEYPVDNTLFNPINIFQPTTSEFPIFNQEETVVEEPAMDEIVQQETPKQEEPPKIRQFQSTSKVVQDIIKEGRSHLGKPYLSAHHGPNAFDCSGFLWYIFNQKGIKIPLNIFQMVKFGKEVSLNDAKEGDIIVTPGKGKSGLHVKMISEINNGKIKVIEAAGRKYGVRETELKNTNNIKSIRRVV